MNQQTQHHEAVAAMAPLTQKITATVDGQQLTFEVKRLETRQIWPILRLGLPLIEGLNHMLGLARKPVDSPLGGKPGGDQALDPLAEVAGSELAGLIRLMAEKGESISEIVAVALDAKLTTVLKFEPQDTFIALRSIYEVNKDFFQNHMAPQLGLDPGKLKAMFVGSDEEPSSESQESSTSGAGETPSSS